MIFAVMIYSVEINRNW